MGTDDAHGRTRGDHDRGLNKGRHIVEAISALDDILTRMDEVRTTSRTLMRHIRSWDRQ